MALGQSLGACGSAPPSEQKEGFTLTPSICVSERYDSNVFFAPPTPGLKRDDFVTNVTPRLRVNHTGDVASTFFEIAGFGETYVYNPELNYMGGSGILSLDLIKGIKKLLPNATLRIIDSFTYTPLPPGFFTPSAGKNPGDPVNIQNQFAQGILTFRTNNFTNNGLVSATYATSAVTTVEASYSNAILRWGSSPVPSTAGTQSGLFDTTTNTGVLGGAVLLSPLDKINARYSYTGVVFDNAGSTIQFYSQMATIGWSRSLTKSVSANIGGGAISVSPGPTTLGTLTWNADVALTVNGQNSRATIAYTRSAFPSIASEPIVLIGDSFVLSAVQRIAQEWELAEVANYVHSAGGEAPNKLIFDSYSASASLSYSFARNWSTTMIYQYMKFNQEQGSTSFNFDRQVISINLTAFWS